MKRRDFGKLIGGLGAAIGAAAFLPWQEAKSKATTKPSSLLDDESFAFPGMENVPCSKYIADRLKEEIQPLVMSDHYRDKHGFWHSNYIAPEDAIDLETNTGYFTVAQEGLYEIHIRGEIYDVDHYMQQKQLMIQNVFHTERVHLVAGEKFNIKPLTTWAPLDFRVKMISSPYAKNGKIFIPKRRT